MYTKIHSRHYGIYMTNKLISNVLFVTGNQRKADYLAKLLGVELEHRKLDLEEIQSADLQEIEDAAARIPIQGARYPEAVEKMTGL